MVKLRLRRTGTHKKPSYRVVAADARTPRDGRFLETVGHYNPVTDPATVEIDEDKALKWLRNGAQPTDTVERLLRQKGIWEKFKPGDAPRTYPEPKAKAEAAAG
jgi:small subunit ribosomal protein S16